MAIETKKLGFGLVSALLLLAAAGACGDDEAPPTKKHRDAGEDDRDAAPMDASEPMRDAAQRPDTGSPEEGLNGSCAIDSNKIFSVAMRNEPFLATPLAVDPAASLFALPFVGRAENAGCLDVVNLATMQGSAQAGAPSMKIASDHCALVKDAVAAAVSGQWMVAMVDNRDPPYDIWLQRYDPAQGEQGAPVRVSEASPVETALAMTPLIDGEHALVAWGDEALDGTNSLYTRLVDRNGALQGEPVRLEQSKLFFRSLAMASLGSGGAGLAYWRYNADFSTSEIVFRALDKDGKPTLDEWVLAAGVGASASVDVATDSSLGGIVFSRSEGTEGRQIWFQRIDDDGRAAALLSGPGRSAPIRIIGAPTRGVDVSVAKLLSGYVLAYRSLSTTKQPKPAIRLAFLDRNGQFVGGSDVSYTSAAGGRTAVEAAYDGRVVIGWSEVNADSGKSELKLVRLPCIGG
ncbi:MAG TPA: hypothetical protein VJV78_06380 [Polyangiales bacterium]|nr:hypothetical protein [Polyangiales bacterium]